MRSYASVAPGHAVPYRHRDPEWLTPAELGGLAERDRIRALYERPAALSDSSAARQARIRRFAHWRARGYSVPRAAGAVGVSRSAGRKYERARKQLTQEDE